MEDKPISPLIDRSATVLEQLINDGYNVTKKRAIKSSTAALILGFLAKREIGTITIVTGKHVTTNSAPIVRMTLKEEELPVPIAHATSKTVTIGEFREDFSGLVAILQRHEIDILKIEKEKKYNPGNILIAYVYLPNFPQRNATLPHSPQLTANSL